MGYVNTQGTYVSSNPGTTASDPATFQTESNGGSGYVNAQGNYVNNNSASAQYTPPSSNNGGSKSSAPVNNYAVVSSAPAQQNVQDLNTGHDNITTAVNTQAQNVQANNQAPVMNGYTVGTNPQSGPGVVTVKSQSNGQTYYAVPSVPPKPGLSADEVTGIINGGQSGSATSSTTSSTVSSGSVSSSSTTNPSGIDINSENSAYEASISKAQSDLASAYSTFQQQMYQLQNGTFPLTSAQSTLLSATSDAFDSMMNNASLKAAALSSETGGIANKINATMGEQANIAADKASALAKMELGFQQQDYTLVNDAYDAFTKSEGQMTDLLTKQHDSIVSQYNSMNDLALRTAQFNETTAKDAASLAQGKYEFRDLKDSMGTTIGTQVFDKSTGKEVSTTYNSGQSDPNTGVTAPTVTTNPDGSVNKDSQRAVLQSVVPKPYQDLVWQIVNGKGEAPNTRTVAGQKLASWVAQVDPSLSDGSGGFDATKYQARLTMQKSLASYTSGSYGQGVLSANKMIEHLNKYVETVDKYGHSVANPLNIEKPISAVLGGVEAAFRDTTRQEAVKEASSIKVGLTDEMAKFFKGTGGTDVQSIKDWGDTLNPVDSAGGIRGSTQGTLDLFSGQIKSFMSQYKDVMGKDADPGMILKPDTMKILSAFKDAGYNIDIPGVPYTSPTAYVNAAPENASELQAVRSQYPNLTPAQALQLAQYNQNQ